MFFLPFFTGYHDSIKTIIANTHFLLLPLCVVKPSIPQNLCTTRIDETSVGLSWAPSAAGAPILAYVIEIRGPGDKDFKKVRNLAIVLCCLLRVMEKHGEW